MQGCCDFRQYLVDISYSVFLLLLLFPNKNIKETTSRLSSGLTALAWGHGAGGIYLLHATSCNSLFSNTHLHDYHVILPPGRRRYA
jgi:hypothetical protein